MFFTLYLLSTVLCSTPFFLLHSPYLFFISFTVLSTLTGVWLTPSSPLLPLSLTTSLIWPFPPLLTSYRSHFYSFPFVSFIWQIQCFFLSSLLLFPLSFCAYLLSSSPPYHPLTRSHFNSLLIFSSSLSFLLLVFPLSSIAFPSICSFLICYNDKSKWPSHEAIEKQLIAKDAMIDFIPYIHPTHHRHIDIHHTIYLYIFIYSSTQWVWTHVWAAVDITAQISF